MKVLILAHGTLGDVQPYVALAHALQQVGHQPLLAAPAGSAPLAEPYDLPFAGVHDGPNTLIEDPEIREAIETNYRGLRGKKIALHVMRRSKPLMARVFTDMVAAAGDGADIVVHAPGIPGHRIAEALGVPAVPALLQPVWVPTATFPNPMLPVPLPQTLNRASYLPTRVVLHSFGGIADRALDLPRRRGRHDILRRPDRSPATVLQGFSRHLLPPDSDYPPWVHTTGFWFLPAAETWTPPTALADFLHAGEPPIYVGFGSMAGTDPRRVGAVIAEAVRLAGYAPLSYPVGAASDSTMPATTCSSSTTPHTTGSCRERPRSSTTEAPALLAPPWPQAAPRSSAPSWPTSRSGPPGRTPSVSRPHRNHNAGSHPETLADAIRTATNTATIARNAEHLGGLIRDADGLHSAIGVLESTHKRHMSQAQDGTFRTVRGVTTREDMWKRGPSG